MAVAGCQQEILKGHQAPLAHQGQLVCAALLAIQVIPALADHLVAPVHLAAQGQPGLAGHLDLAALAPLARAALPVIVAGHLAPLAQADHLVALAPQGAALLAQPDHPALQAWEVIGIPLIFTAVIHQVMAITVRIIMTNFLILLMATSGSGMVVAGHKPEISAVVIGNPVMPMVVIHQVMVLTASILGISF